jgi:signal transduction histidine kinase
MSDPPTNRATILVVDDNEANRALARDTLEDEGYRVVLAEGGQLGIEAFEREAPDCVVLDVRMPGLDGFAVCERIRALPGGADTPVLFVTALRDIDTFDQALRAGGDDFLTKPVRPTELVVRVQTALKVRRMGAELRDHFALLKRQRDDLVRVQLQRERLMAFVVHDLKNPVNSMDLQAQLLLRDRTLSESARAAAAQIRSEARQLGRMIVNLLDLSKADEGKLVPRIARVDFRALVDGVLGELRVSAQAREIVLRSNVAVPQVNGDEDLLRRTVANLVENAIRHSPHGGVVEVDVVQDGDATKLCVADTGSGVPAAMRERIFDPFLQIESSDRSVNRSGRGLGLTFCRLAVEAHGGRIWVEEGAPGAVFCVKLPPNDADG